MCKILCNTVIDGCHHIDHAVERLENMHEGALVYVTRLEGNEYNPCPLLVTDSMQQGLGYIARNPGYLLAELIDAQACLISFGRITKLIKRSQRGPRARTADVEAVFEVNVVDAGATSRVLERYFITHGFPRSFSNSNYESLRSNNVTIDYGIWEDWISGEFKETMQKLCAGEDPAIPSNLSLSDLSAALAIVAESDAPFIREAIYIGILQGGYLRSSAFAKYALMELDNNTASCDYAKKFYYEIVKENLIYILHTTANKYKHNVIELLAKNNFYVSDEMVLKSTFPIAEDIMEKINYSPKPAIPMTKEGIKGNINLKNGKTVAINSINLSFKSLTKDVIDDIQEFQDLMEDLLDEYMCEKPRKFIESLKSFEEIASLYIQLWESNKGRKGVCLHHFKQWKENYLEDAEDFLYTYLKEKKVPDKYQASLVHSFISDDFLLRHICYEIVDSYSFTYFLHLENNKIIIEKDFRVS